ncbi:MAG: SurA N-terminal domain-containing protein [Pseudomonadota bacterium]
MLQKLRDQTQSTGFKILVGAIIIVLTLFGFGATNLFLGADPEIAVVGDFELTVSGLERETERERVRILSRQGPDFDPDSIDRAELSQFVLQQVISRQVAYQTAAELGIEVPDDEINDALVNAPAFQIDGQFSENVYRQYLANFGYNPVEFLTEYGRGVSADMLTQQVLGSYALVEWEIDELVRVLNQTRDIAYLPLLVENYEGQISVAAEDIELRYEEQESLYMTEAAVDVEYLHLSVAALAADPSISVSEEELQGLYEEEKALALGDESRGSSHILIQVNDDRNEADAQALIDSIAERLSAGEDFGVLASELSEDPGSKAQNGALPPVGKGIYDPAFESALWALTDVGEVSAPVRSSFGYHIIRLDEIVTKDYPELDSQRDQLSQQLREVKAAELFADAARELEELAYNEQFALTETAAELGLTLQQSARVSRSTAQGVLNNPALLNAMFSSEVIGGTNSDAIALNESEMVVLRVTEDYPPDLKPLADVEAEIRATLTREGALALIEEHRVQGLARLEAGESVTEIAQDLGSSWQSFANLRRSPRTAEEAQIPQQVFSAVFDLPRPLDGEKSVGSAELNSGAALVTVTRVLQGDADATSAVELAQIRNAVNQQSGQLETQALMAAAEQLIGVQRP